MANNTDYRTDYVGTLFDNAESNRGLKSDLFLH